MATTTDQNDEKFSAGKCHLTGNKNPLTLLTLIKNGILKKSGNKILESNCSALALLKWRTEGAWTGLEAVYYFEVDYAVIYHSYH